MTSDDTAVTGAAGDIRALLQLEEYKTLRGEIARLDERVERGISTMLAINAVMYSIVYLDGYISVGKALSASGDVQPNLTAVKPTALFILLFVNVILALRYIASTRHIDRIGGYVARLEHAIYHNMDEPLGWELFLRDQFDTRALVKKDTGIDMFRRYVVWVSLVTFNLYALADITCILPFSIGVSLCQV